MTRPNDTPATHSEARSHALDLILRACGRLEENRLDDAEAFAREALAKDPYNPDAFHALALAEHRRGRLASAEALLKRAIERDGNVAAWYGDMGNVLQDQGKLVEAAACYRRALCLKPDFAEAQNDLGTACFAMGQFETAVESYRRAIKLRPEHIVAHANLGAVYRRLGLLQEARRALQRELALRLKNGAVSLLHRLQGHAQGVLPDPDNPAWLAARAELEFKRGNSRLAEQLSRRVAGLDAGTAHASGLLGQIEETKGKLKQALAMTRRAIRAKPASAPLHEQLGRIAAAAGRLEEAMAAYEESLRLQPQSASTLAGLAALLIKREEPARAETLYRRALVIEPHKAALHCGLGEALAKQRRYADAEAGFRRAIEIEPGDLAPHVRLAEMLRETERLDEAETCAKRALELDRESAVAEYTLGTVLNAKGMTKAAIARFERSLELDPQRIQAMQQLAMMLREEEGAQAAEGWLRRALALRPDEPTLFADLGLMLADQMRYDEALDCYDRALGRAPNSVPTLNRKGLLLDYLGRREESLELFAEALRIDPEDDHTHYNIAITYLKYGDFAQGWDGYERRRKLASFVGRLRRFPLRDWDGSRLEEKTILVCPEQGLGDEIMFGSCLPDLAAKARHVVFECDPKLEAIFQRSLPQCTVVSRHRTVANDWVNRLDPRPDLQTPIGSLAKHFRRRLEDFPQRNGYLTADPQKVAFWRCQLEALGPARKIGLSWRGGVGFTGRMRRSLSLVQLLPILRMPGLQFVNLQYTNELEEIRMLEERHGVRIHHWQEAIDDYDETAALVCAVDSVLTVCTAIVHLTAALGRPATVMVPFGADWRYGAAGERMPWYPSVRLLRQERIGEWGPVLDRVAREQVTGGILA